jgi:D-tyrosyl-tRNA(Tyr) deacylase
VIALIQRVSSASVVIDQNEVSSIDMGLLVMLGIKAHDSAAVTQKLCDKIISLRVFDDSAGNMNLDIQSVGGSVLVVPNFTLAADTSKGNRPGFSTAMSPDKAEPLFELFMKKLQTTYPKVKQGIFGADMQVRLVNDGPITISLETKNP